MPNPLRKAARVAGSAALVVLITAVLTEAFLVALRRIPALAGVPPFTRLARSLYQRDRAILHVEPECARWDPELAYTLRPGRCEFRNTEFRTSLDVNSAGVRDSEGALAGPELIVTGDSFAVGWGVEPQDRYGDRLARALGLRGLNTAVSSYGTVRELSLLRRVDLSRVRLIVLQYCDNDFPENETFLKAGDRLATVARETWERRVRDHARVSRYLPGIYLARSLNAALHRLTAGKPAPAAASPPADRGARRREVEAFCHALEKAPVDLSGIPVVVLELNPYNLDATWFIPMLAEELAAGRHPALAGRVFPVDVASRLTPGDFFVLDDHLTPAGHGRVAEVLLPACAARVPPRRG